MSNEQGVPDKGRRTALTALIALAGTTIGVILATPGLRFLAAPILRAGAGSAQRWVKVARLAGLPDDTPVALPVVGEQVDAWTRAPHQRLGTVWLRKKSEHRVVALQAECPHLGCSVQLDEAHHRFACPCHESFFTLEGRATSGPSPRGMDELETRITADGDVEVAFARYRTQTSGKVRLG